MKALIFVIVALTTFSASAKDFCHFTYEAITNSDVPVNDGEVDKATGQDYIFYYELSVSVYKDNQWSRESFAQLDCEDGSADTAAFKATMLEKCSDIHMGGITVPMTEDFNFSQACG